MMDINVIVGGLVAALTIVFFVAPAVVVLLFGYSADTYMGQVKGGLVLIGVILGLVVLVLMIDKVLGILQENLMLSVI